MVRLFSVYARIATLHTTITQWGQSQLLLKLYTNNLSGSRGVQGCPLVHDFAGLPAKSSVLCLMTHTPINPSYLIIYRSVIGVANGKLMKIFLAVCDAASGILKPVTTILRRKIYALCNIKI